MDRVETRTDPLSRDESFAYDLMGNLVTWTDRKGQITTYQYDGLDRQTFVGFGTTGSPPSYASTISTTYDAGDRPTDIVDSVAGTIERTYDLLDRLTEEETPEGTVTYTYDGANRRASMTVAGQTAVSYTFDNADRLTGVTRGTAAVSIAYDNADKRTSLTLPNGIVVEYGYDDDSRLTGLTYKLATSTLGTLTYAYDANGQRTSVGGTYARTGLPAALTSATYDDANQIATFGGTTFSYDDNGNLTSDSVRSYSWNARNQLASLTGPVNGTFAYDGMGRRRAKTIGSTTTQFMYDGLNPVQELSSGTPTANLLTGLAIDEFFTRTDSAGVRNYLTDVLGSSLALADGSGTIQTEYTYSPFGETTPSGASTSNSFAFTGRESDATGLHYYRARYLHPSAHRFISEDPLGVLAGDPNVHAYVFNRPTGLTDPTGEFAWLVLPAAGCVGGALGMGMTQGWGGRKLALGCALGAGIGLGFAAAPALGSAAAAAAGAAGVALARFGTAAGAAARATAAAAARATTNAARATAKAARAGARYAHEAYARATGHYPAKAGGGGHPQSYSPKTGQYVKPGPGPLTPQNVADFMEGALNPGPGPASKAGVAGAIVRAIWDFFTSR
jgi:RHS repeat-associated protein